MNDDEIDLDMEHNCMLQRIMEDFKRFLNFAWF